MIDLYASASLNQIKFDISALDLTSVSITHSYDLNNLVAFKGGIKALLYASSHWFFRGYADYGWITHGRYSLSSISLPVNTKGNVADGSIACGYLFYPSCKWQIGPTLGWSYNMISLFEETTKTQWGGPFVGVDTLYNFTDCWGLSAGYELHLAAVKVKTDTSSTAPTSRSYIRSVWGNLAHVGTTYNISKWWHIGLDLIGYVYSTSKNGYINPSTLTGVESSRILKNVKISTGEVRLYTGIQF